MMNQKELILIFKNAIQKEKVKCRKRLNHF